MTMQSKVSKAVFSGNGATTDFPFDFKVWDTSELFVTITGPDGASMPATGWTATLTDTGGTVTYRKDGAPLPSGWKMAILRDMPFTQGVDLLSGTRFDPQVIEDTLDMACAERQQLLEQLQRAVILPPTSDETPEDMAHELLRARDDVQDMRDDVQDMLAEVGTEIGNHSIVTAEGGTAGRTLADRFADVINVKDFGAKGDGIADDTAAVAAWRAKLSSGGLGYVPNGKYKVDGKVIDVNASIGNLNALGLSLYSPNNDINRDSSIINNSRNVDFNSQTIDAPHIAIKDTVSHIDDAPAPTENFKRGVGIYQEMVVTGHSANTSESPTQNFTGIFGVAKNNAAGFVGVVPVAGRYYEVSGDDNPEIATYGNPKGAAGEFIAWGNAAYEDGGYCAGAEIDMINTYANDGKVPCYENDDYRAFKRQTRGLYVATGGKQPVTDGIVVAKFGDYENGCWNGITIGGKAMSIGGQSGVKGTVGLNFGSWAGNNFGHTCIRFGKAVRHIYARDGLITAAPTIVILPTENLGCYSRLISADGNSAVVEFKTVDDINNYTSSNAANVTPRGSIGYSSNIGGMLLKSEKGSIVQWIKTSSGTDKKAIFDGSSLRPGDDNATSLGQGNYRWSNIYAATGSINTSDEREKQAVQPYPDNALDAWGDVQFRQFFFNDAVEKKGDSARIHAGLIAQQIIEAFKKHNLDATKYGLLCYDEWGDEYEDIEVIDKEAEYDSEGNEISPAIKHTEKKLVTHAGNRYGIRYSEALCIEAAYQRRRADRLEERIKAIEAKLGEINV